MRLLRVQYGLLVCALLASLAKACAGQSDLGGSVAGLVLSPDGRGIRGAFIRLEDTATGNHIDAVSGASGEFRLTEIMPAAYILRVRAPGWSDWEADNLAIEMGTAFRLNARLALPSVHRTVLVNARFRADAQHNQSAGTPSDDLPGNGQHWSALAALFSGDVPGDDGSVSFRGLSPLMNSIAVDGADNTLAFRARERGSESNGFATGQSTLAGFRISGNGSSSEEGRAAGGTITAVTKSGSNRMHGQAVFYDRGSIGQAFNAYSNTMQVEPAGTTVTSTGQPVINLNGQPVTYVEVPCHAPDRRQEWEVSAGGPILRDRAFWFFAWEQHERHDPAVARANEPEVFFSAPSAATLTTLEARIANSTNPIASRCGAGAAAAASGSTAAAACAYASVMNDLNGLLGTVPRSSRQTNVFPKINWRINQRNNLVLQYNRMRRTAPYGLLGGASETDAIDSFGNSSTSDDAAIARWEYFATPRLLSSARLQWSRDLLSQAPGTPSPFEQQFANNAWGLPPQVVIDRSEGFAFGTLSTANKREYPAETRQQFMDAAIWLRGKNALRFGYDYNHVIDVVDGLNGENGEYSYATLGDFVADMLAPDSCDGTTTGTGHDPCYTRFRQTVGLPNWSFETADYAPYAADEWRLSPRMTLTAALRYEYERVPDTNSALVNSQIPETARLPHNRDNFAPRAGFSWNLVGNGRTILRGGYGIFFARIPNATVFSALTSTGSARSPRAYAYRPLDEGAPAFPYVFSADDTPYTDPHAPDQHTTAPDVAYFDTRFRHPEVNQADLSLEQALGSKTVLTFTVAAADGHDLTQFVDSNIDLTSAATIFYSIVAPGNEGVSGPLARAAGSVDGYTNIVYAQRFYDQRLNPAYGAVTDMISESNSSYRGATVRLSRRLSRTLTVNAAWTWSHALDDNQNEATFADRNDVYDPADLPLEHGTSNYDVRQRVAGAVILHEPWRSRGPAALLLGGYSLSAIGAWRTGLPYTMRTLGSVPTPSCSYQDWLNAGGPAGGANCLKAVNQPDETFTAGQAGEAVPIPGLGPSLNGSGGEDLIPAIGRNTFRFPATENLDMRLTRRIRLSDRYSFDLIAEAFNALNHQNVTAIQTVGYRLTNDTSHPNMATLTWQSGVRPGTKTVMTNGTTESQYVVDPTAAFGDVTNANSTTLQRERQIQAGLRFIF